MVFVDVLSVIIGIIFIWMLLGVAVMQIQEWTVGWLGLRADSLEDAIQGMLLTPKTRRGPWRRLWEQLRKRRWIRWLPWVRQDVSPTLVKLFYDHPLIRSMEQQRTNPSYLAADCFAQVLLDTVMVAGLPAPAISRALQELDHRWPESADTATRSKLRELLAVTGKAGPGDLGLAELHRQLAQFRQDLVASAPARATGADLADLLEATLRSELPHDVDAVVKHIERGAAGFFVTSPLLQQRLELFLRQANIEADTAAEKLTSLQQQIEAWFDETMDHVTGWYKRNRQWGAFAIGLVIAAILNLDSIHISTELWRQPALREALAVAATQELDGQPPTNGAEEPTVAINQLEASLSALRLPIGWQFTPVTYDPAHQKCRLIVDSEAADQVSGLAWNGQCLRWHDAPRGWGILAKLAGIIITAAAAMQGAPFWFDILDKIVPVRAAGVRPQEQPAAQ